MIRASRFSAFTAAAIFLALSAAFVTHAPKAAAATTPVDVLAPSSDPFRTPDGLQDAVAFWTKCYATYTTRQVVMHDNRYLNITYGVLDFTYLDDGKRSDGELDLLQDAGVEAERKRIVILLDELASYRQNVPVTKLRPELKKLYEAFDPVDELDKFHAAAERVRGQRGQKDKFLKGISDVGPYMPKMEQIFRSRGLPSDLSRLTFVESMFNLHAYSKVGAAGPWQFMSGTGKLFLTITPEVDERMDPIKAADAASRLLGTNYRELGNWGLALTAYNHGVGGMRRAVREVGSDDIGQIVWAYEQRSFGFASRNFFAEFLAARDVYNNREKYFGAALKAYPPKAAIAYDEVVLPDYVAMPTLVSYTGVTEAQVRELNPALTPYVLDGSKYLPKGYPIRIPAGDATKMVKAYAQIPKELRFNDQKPNEFHVVKRGDTMVVIAKKYGMTVDALMNLNALGPTNRLRAGQKLRVLAVGGKTPALIAALEKKPSVKVLPAVKLPEDMATPVPTPELSAEEQAVLAAAEAPAVDEHGSPTTVASATGTNPSATGSAILKTAPAGPKSPGSGLASLLAASLGLRPSDVVFTAPPAAAATPAIALATPAPSAAPIAAPSSVPTPVAPPSGSTVLALADKGTPGSPAGSSLSPLIAASASSTVPALPAAALASIPPPRPETSPLLDLRAPATPPRDRSAARSGAPAKYPGGLHCTLTAR